jgi:hypothetical protein
MKGKYMNDDKIFTDILEAFEKLTSHYNYITLVKLALALLDENEFIQRDFLKNAKKYKEDITKLAKELRDQYESAFEFYLEEIREQSNKKISAAASRMAFKELDKQSLHKLNKGAYEGLNAFLEHTRNDYVVVNGEKIPVIDAYAQLLQKKATLSKGDSANKLIKKMVGEMLANEIRVTNNDKNIRLDTCVRRDLLDTFRNYQNDYRMNLGKQLGLDGIEITVHGNCAPDHVGIQGHRYSIAEFNKLQDSLTRPISTCNCYHTFFPCKLSGPSTYTQKKLDEIRRKSAEKVTYTDSAGELRTCTRYEGTQELRRQETAMRRLDDKIKMCERAGLSTSKMKAVRSRQLARYRQTAKSMGLPTSENRTRSYM